MTSSRIFFALLTLIVISQGAVKLNEQFIVAGCFIAFSYVAYIKVGSIVSAALENRGREMILEQETSRKALEESIGVVNGIQEQRIGFNKRIKTIGKVFTEQTKNYIEKRQGELERKVLEQLIAPLEEIGPKEEQMRVALEKGSVEKSIKELIETYKKEIKTGASVKKINISKIKKVKK
jgi:hypothetical protein